jgi:hypothetical protein
MMEFVVMYTDALQGNIHWEFKGMDIENTE